jgi:6,7-dimethyl-8-ribityllumazine synthase
MEENARLSVGDALASLRERLCALILVVDQEEITMNRRDTETLPLTQGGGARIALVQSCWHKDIVDRCRTSFVAEIAKLGHDEAQIDLFEVPGAFEIPLQAKLLARSGRYRAIVAAGLVVDGGIYRHDFVAGTVIDALMRVQLETEVPIISAVLTPQSFHEHADHRQFFLEHFRVKGAEAAAACARTIENLDRARRLGVDARASTFADVRS